MVLGIRGMPGVQGGVETHAEQLYERLARLGCEVTALVRSHFVSPGQRSSGAVRLRRLWAPRSSGLEAFVHSFLGVLYAAYKRPDILHIHAVGPAIVTPIARAFGLKVVVTHHGADYAREKWGGFASGMLRLGEQAGMRCAHACIAISRSIAEHIRSQYRREPELIPNGMPINERPAGSAFISQLGLKSGQYFLQVSRMVPEKRQMDLIRAYERARVNGWKLVLAGHLEDDAYTRQIRAAAAGAGVVLAGFVSGAPLRELYANAGAFVLPSSHEGLPIVVLEALSFGLPVIASDIPANLEASSYFPLGDLAALAAALERITAPSLSRPAQAPSQLMEKYDWNVIAERTLAVYQRLLQRAAVSSSPRVRVGGGEPTLPSRAADEG